MKLPQIVLLIAPWILNRNLADAQILYHTYTPTHILNGNFSERFSSSLTGMGNPALTPSINGFEVASVAEKKYSTDINSLIITGGLKFHNNGLNISVQHFGNSDYSEKTFGAAIGKNLGKINVGVAIKYTSVNITSLASTHFIQSTFASVIKITESVAASLVLNNPNFFIFKSIEVVRPASGFSLGFGWQVSPLVYTGIEYIKSEQQPLSVVLNLQYEFAKDLSAMLNWTTANNQPYVNISWRYSAMKFGAGCSYHSSLGISPAITMLYQKISKVE